MSATPALFYTCLLVFQALLPTQPASGAEESLELYPQQLGAGVWYLRGDSGMATAANRGFMSNAGFVVGSDGIAVFDTLATPALGEALLRAIRRVSDKPIRYVITSHYHADHFYGVQAFVGTGAQLLGHTNGQRYLGSEDAANRLAQRREALAPWVDDQTRLVAADRWLDFSEGQTLVLDLGDLHLELTDVSGSHSDSDIMLLVIERNILFAGDLFATGRLPFVAGANTGRWLEILSVLKQSGASIVVPGHGQASRDVQADIALTEKYLLFLRVAMGEAVDQLVAFSDAYAATDWTGFEDMPAFAEANRRNAYSVYLEMEAASFD
jgi:glyoxylase-like metal-dependent hydrolase (beta-lactamase superfamily II)